MKILISAFFALNSLSALAADPIPFVLSQLGEWYGAAGSRTVVARVNAVEGPRQATVTVTDSNLLDDSVFATRHAFLVELIEDKWIVIEQAELFKCQPGRGQQKFAKEKRL